MSLESDFPWGSGEAPAGDKPLVLGESHGLGTKLQWDGGASPAELPRQLSSLPHGQSSSQRVISTRKWAKVGDVGCSLVLSAALLGAVRELSLSVGLPWKRTPGGCLPPGGPLSQMGLTRDSGLSNRTGHAKGLLTSLVTFLLLRLGSAQLRVVGPGHPLTATVGQDVVLPCHLSPQRDARTLEVRWIRHSLSETVHHYRNGEDLYGEQMEAYVGRTELARDGLSAGSLDLRITGLRPSDDGQYVCTMEDAYNEAIVELEVSAQLRVVGPGQPLTATVGQDVVLPCHLSPQRDARTMEVRWIRHRLSETVHYYRNGEDLYREQMGAYVGRTELARDGLSAGNLDLRIMELRPSDDGLYLCTVEDADAYDEAIVELEVSATGADPHVSLGGYEAGGVRVLCRSAGWYPLPQLLWRDARGQHLPSVSQTHSQDQEGLFEIEGAIIVTGSVEGPLSCVVRSSRLQQERESSLHIAAPFFHNAQPWMVALALVLVLLAVSIGLGVYLFQKKGAQSRELDKQAAELAWRRFLLPHNRVKVTLDPHTAHRKLVLSQDQTSVRRERKQQQVPDTPERFDCWCCVLGREEFREGRHCWVVVVEGEWLKYSWWAVGVARASVKRKGWIDMSPEGGIWAVQYDHGQLWSLTSPRTTLSLSPVPTRIWVCLDCTQQQASFINADNGVEIFTFTAASFNGESIRPWFWLKTQGIQLCLRDSTL